MQHPSWRGAQTAGDSRGGENGWMGIYREGRARDVLDGQQVDVRAERDWRKPGSAVLASG